MDSYGLTKSQQQGLLYTGRIDSLTPEMPKPQVPQCAHKNILVLDFETTGIDGSNFTYPVEIIYFAAVPIFGPGPDWHSDKSKSFNEFVRPTQKPTLTDYCKSFTGISQEIIDNAKPFPEVYNNFCKWLEKIGLNNDFVIAIDGRNDKWRIAQYQFILCKMQLPVFFKRFVCVYKVFMITEVQYTADMMITESPDSTGYQKDSFVGIDCREHRQNALYDAIYLKMVIETMLKSNTRFYINTVLACESQECQAAELYECDADTFGSIKFVISAGLHIDKSDQVNNVDELSADLTLPQPYIHRTTKGSADSSNFPYASMTSHSTVPQIGSSFSTLSEQQVSESELYETPNERSSPDDSTRKEIQALLDTDIPDDVIIDTKQLCQDVNDELKRGKINQSCFAQNVILKTQGTLSALIKNPKPWDKLTSVGQITYRRMHNWLNLPVNTKYAILRVPSQDAPDKDRSSSMKKHPRFRFTDEQKVFLTGVFKNYERPTKEDIRSYARLLNLDFGVVETFFKNARNRQWIGGSTNGLKTSKQYENMDYWDCDN